ncbi:MAG: Clp protease N-terminal domain-containing protein, partial [Actinomycetota bacterium]|nr:Clp protease N-terminal domain-containing protein [Actinomycetota bacterium]
MISLDKLTIKAREALADAQRLAGERHHQFIEPEHLLLALLRQEGGTVPSLLEKIGEDPATLSAATASALEKVPKVTGAVGTVQLSPRTAAVLEAALAEADKLKDEYISTEHLFLAIAEEKRGDAGDILRRRGIDRDRILQAMSEVRGSQRITDPEAEERFQALERFGRDLTELARRG